MFLATGTESAAYLFKVRSLASQRLRTRGVSLKISTNGLNDQQSNHHQYKLKQTLLVAGAYKSINGILNQNWPEWRKEAKKNGESDQEKKAVLIGFDIGEKPSECLPIKYFPTFHGLFLHAAKLPLITEDTA